MFNRENNIFDTKIKLPVKLHYQLYKPDNYHDNDTKYPLVLYLHGLGERGVDLKKIEVNGLPEVIGKGKTFPFLTLAPQCPEFGWWSRSEYIEALADLLKKVIEVYRVNSNQIYVTGLSMGGYGTLALTQKYPDLFAAIIPMTTRVSTVWETYLCGFFMENWIRHIPFSAPWLFMTYLVLSIKI